MRIVTISNKVYCKILFFTLILLLYMGSIQAQENTINQKFVSPADFRQYEEKLISDINWLANTSRDTLIEQRKLKEDLTIKWIYDCPYIRVVIEPYVMKLSRKNADLLLSFIFGYTLQKLQSPQDKDPVKANIAGLNMLLKDYSFNKNVLNSDPAIDQLLEKQSTGSLAGWIQPNLSQQK